MSQIESNHALRIGYFGDHLSEHSAIKALLFYSEIARLKILFRQDFVGVDNIFDADDKLGEDQRWLFICRGISC